MSDKPKEHWRQFLGSLAMALITGGSVFLWGGPMWAAQGFFLVVLFVSMLAGRTW